MRLIPTKQQWRDWTLPSKLTAVGAAAGVLGLLLSVVMMFERGRPMEATEVPSAQPAGANLNDASELVDTPKAPSTSRDSVADMNPLAPSTEPPNPTPTRQQSARPGVFGNKSVPPKERLDNAVAPTEAATSQAALQVIIAPNTSYDQPSWLYFAPLADFLVVGGTFANTGRISSLWDSGKAQFVNRSYYGNFSSIVPRHRFTTTGDGLFFALYTDNAIVVRRAPFELNADSIIAISPYGVLFFDTQLGTIRSRSLTEPFSRRSRRPMLGEPVAEIPLERRATDYAISPNAEYVAVGYEGKTSIYSTRTRLEVAVAEESGFSRTFQDYYLSFSPDSRYFAYITAKANIHYPGTTSVVVLEVGPWVELGRFSSGSQEIYNFAFSHDSQSLVTASGGGRVIAWNLDTGEPMREFDTPEEYRGSYIAAAISPGDKYVVASRDGWMSTTTGRRRYGRLDYWSYRDGDYLFSVDTRGDGFIAHLEDGRFYVSDEAEKYVTIGFDLQSYQLPRFRDLYPDRLASEQVMVQREHLIRLMNGR